MESPETTPTSSANAAAFRGSGLARSSSRVAEALGKSLAAYNKQKTTTGTLGTRKSKKQPLWRSLVTRCLDRCNCCQSAEGAVPPAVSLTTDVEDLKRTVRQRMSKQTYSVKDYYKSEGFCQKLARSNWFENFTLFIIAVNSIWIAIDTDQNDASVISDARVEFIVAENLFCTFFTFELLVRLFAFRRKIYALSDAWFVLDSLLVSLMIVETWITPLVLSILQISSEGMGDATILRLVRLLRLARMTRVAKLLRAFPEVLIMIKGISAAARSVVFTIFLLILVLYVFGIAFTQICDGLAVGEKSFPTVLESMLTLLIHGVFMDDMAELVAEIRADSAMAFATFIVFVLVASITLMNMLIGVLCEVVSMVGQSEREELLVELVKRELLDIIIEADEDGDGLMSHAEFLRILETPEGLRALETVGVDPVGLIDYADTIFQQDDGNVGETILFSHFMNEVLQLRGSNTATVKDLINMRKFVEKSTKEVRKDVSQLSEQVERLEDALKDIRSPRQGTVVAPLRATAKPEPRIGEMSPVPLVAHMPRRNMPSLPNAVPPEGARYPELDGSLPQKLLEMQEILSELLGGPQGRLEDNGDAAGGRPRIQVGSKWRQSSRGESDEEQPVRRMRVVHGRPVPHEELPRGRMVHATRTRRGASSEDEAE